MSDIEKLWEEDSTPDINTNLKNDALKEVSFWAKEQLRVQEEVTQQEEVLADLKKEFKDISEQKLPDAMRECNLAEIKLSDGSKISVQQFYSARIGKEREEEAFSWLKDNGHEDIIKNVVSLQFGRGEDDSADGLLKNLTSQGYAPSNKRWVEPMTLKAFVKEQAENGTDLPFETFNVFIGQKTKITKG
ncbi:MAG: hypothetical protein CL867_11405 [Cytophagaceae bacterium]|nr:hypothetical protein [Cytophagaceae bacterium]|tara:strand:+ start:647 stop:1213 length:567 start_codon:yes stop_codon:yes gene_type:complete